MKPDTQERPDFEKAATNLQQCKDQIAKNHNEESWASMEAIYFDDNGICTIDQKLYWEVAKLYAQQKTEAFRKRIEELEALLLQETGKCMVYTQEIEDLKKRLHSCPNCLSDDILNVCRNCKQNF